MLHERTDNIGSPKLLIRVYSFNMNIFFCPHNKITITSVSAKELTLDLEKIEIITEANNYHTMKEIPDKNMHGHVTKLMFLQLKPAQGKIV